MKVFLDNNMKICQTFPKYFRTKRYKYSRYHPVKYNRFNSFQFFKVKRDLQS